MRNPDEIIQSFEDFKNLSQQEKDFFIFQSLHKLSSGIEAFLHNFSLEILDKRFDAKYAFKHIEKEVENLREEIKKCGNDYDNRITLIKKDIETTEEKASIRFAEKRVEYILYGMIGLILLAFFGALIAQTLK